MNGAHLHLLLNHVPVLGTVFGLGLLVVALVSRSDAVRKCGMGLLVVAALAAIPVYLSGEPAEDTVEKIAGVAMSAIERHEDTAGVALGGSLVVGILSLAGLIFFRGDRRIPAWLASLTLAGALVVSGLMAWTANIGGQIRHSEIRSSGVPAASRHHDD